jgi:preprotein translocase SecF subunit
MFEIIRETHVRFMAIRRRAYIFSAALILMGIVSFIAHGGFRMGVDFAGGRLIEYQFNQPIDPGTIRTALSEIGVEGSEVQQVGDDRSFIVRLPVSEQETAAAEQGPSIRLLDALKQQYPGLSGEILREELVGPRVGSELRQRAVWAIIISLVLILAYVAIRFEFKYALGGVIALLHDVVVVMAIFSVLNIEITIQVVAALLTIAGFSINDTVVIFDRIREQSRLHVGEKLAELIDRSINQTMSRTIITSLTVLLTSLALYFFGGEVIHDFALAMTLGIVIGSYSTIYIASALALEMSKTTQVELAKT